jgi:GT2 family glycosyltransferase
MDVSVIIVNYKTCSLVEACIESILKNTFSIEYEIIVIDNASKDGSIEYLKPKFPDVIFIQSELNLGFGGANNLGLEIAKGEYYFFLNSDTIVLENILLNLLIQYRRLQQKEKIGALGVFLLDRNSNINYTNSFGYFPTLKSFLRDAIGYFFKCSRKEETFYTKQNGCMDVDYIIGADLFVSRKVIEDIGAFDTNFFMYWEEVDLQKRMSNSGYKRKILSTGKLIHLEGMSTQKKVGLFRKKMYHTSLCYYFTKHRPFIETLILKILFLCFSLRLLTKEKNEELSKYWRSILNNKLQ